MFGAVTAFAFSLAVAGLWLLRAPHVHSVVHALVSRVVLVLAMRVRFDTPFGQAPFVTLE